MSILAGLYYDGVQPVGMPAQLHFAAGEATLSGPSVSGRFAVASLKVSPRIGSTNRFIFLPDGGQFECPDQELLDSLPQESALEGPVARLEKRWRMALACLVVSLGLLAAGYFFGLPAAAGFVAARIPMETEAFLGQEAMGWLDGKVFRPTRLAPGVQREIQAGFDKLRQGLPLREYCRLEFRGASIGPNAFALPGGTVIVTDEMVDLTASTEEVVAVLAHEIGHVELRHAMRGLLQDSVVAVAIAAVTSDATSLSAAFAGLPVLVAQMKYSREFETAADEFAFRLLRQRGYSPLAFASLMEKLAKFYGQEGDEAMAYLSSHPVTAERVRRARAAAKD